MQAGELIVVALKWVIHELTAARFSILPATSDATGLEVGDS